MEKINRRSFLRNTAAAGAVGATIAAPAIAEAAVPSEALTPEERLRAAAADIRAALKELGVESYMVMIREESSAVAKVLDFNRDGSLHRLIGLA